MDLLEEEKVKKRINEIQIELSEHSISKNRKSFKADTISADVIERRKVLVPELLELERKMSEFKILNRRTLSGRSEIDNFLFDFLVGIFGEKETKKLTTEYRNRCKGHSPTNIQLEYGYSQKDKNEIKRLTKLSTDLKEILINARKSIDRYIRSNEPDVNKAAYHSQVKELIRCMPSEKEIYSIKVNI